MGSNTCNRRVISTRTSLAVYAGPCIWYDTLTTLTTCQWVQYLGEKRPSDCSEVSNACYAKVGRRTMVLRLGGVHTVPAWETYVFQHACTHICLHWAATAYLPRLLRMHGATHSVLLRCLQPHRCRQMARQAGCGSTHAPAEKRRWCSTTTPNVLPTACQVSLRT